MWRYCQIGFIWMVAGYFVPNRTLEPKLVSLKTFVFYILLGGLLCFDIREQCMEEWEDKLKELEMKGIWETVTKEKLPVDNDDKKNAFVCKLLWKILKIELYNVSKHTCNWILCIRYALLFSRTLNEVVYGRDVMDRWSLSPVNTRERCQSLKLKNHHSRSGICLLRYLQVHFCFQGWKKPIDYKEST